ncbi:MAG: hypothetical protein GY696_39965 [Gammaproteobacteria bacterium]|nr:hypothetical protein [Gammaproteobacteria bacterium]
MGVKRDIFKETFSSAKQRSEWIMAFAEGVAVDISNDSLTTNTKPLYIFWGDERMDCNAIHPQPLVRPTAMLSRMASLVMHAANKGTGSSSVRWVATCIEEEVQRLLALVQGEPPTPPGHSQAGHAQRGTE